VAALVVYRCRYWSAHRDEGSEGTPWYYYNSHFQRSTWEKPSPNSRGEVVKLPQVVVAQEEEEEEEEEEGAKDAEGEGSVDGGARAGNTTGQTAAGGEKTVNHKLLLSPHSWERLKTKGGEVPTDWYVVITDVDSRYFCNRATGQSTWMMPKEVKDILQENIDWHSTVDAEKLRAEARRGILIRPEDRVDEVAVATSNENFAAQGKRRKQAIAQFKAMLSDVGVGASAQWREWQPKLEADPRYRTLGTMAERRGAFDTYAK
jgi:hypothetical protein